VFFCRVIGTFIYFLLFWMLYWYNNGICILAELDLSHSAFAQMKTCCSILLCELALSRLRTVNNKYSVFQSLDWLQTKLLQATIPYLNLSKYPYLPIWSTHYTHDIGLWIWGTDLKRNYEFIASDIFLPGSELQHIVIHNNAAHPLWSRNPGGVQADAQIDSSLFSLQASFT
jgi:hypothetical protein